MTGHLDRIAIMDLRYVRLNTANLPAAIDFARDILGLQLTERTETQAFFRSDDRGYTLCYRAGDPAEQAIGLEVRDEDALDKAVDLLETKGYAVTRGDAAEAVDCKVRELARVRMPSGYDVELVVRPLHSGWRFYGTRDAGLTGLEDVAVRGEATGAGTAFWTTLMSGSVSDWVGDSTYIRFDDRHHRIAVHPSRRQGLLAIEFGVEDVDLLMQNAYFIRAAQIRIVDGPGRRPTSNQMFLTFQGPDGVLFSFVTDGERGAGDRRPRQFTRTRGSFCSWNSDTDVPEYQ